MPVNDELGTRIKSYYEEASKTRLLRRTPVMIRLDGKAFHTFTRGLKKPFDSIFSLAMKDTMRYLCEHIQGCVLGYTQSDEITLVLVDYKKLNSCAWFDGEVQKICSISASMATWAFGKSFSKMAADALPAAEEAESEDADYIRILNQKADSPALFDSRCFNVPREEVANALYWRQLDAERNLAQSLGQANFSHKELQGKSCAAIKEMLKAKGISYEALPIWQRRGSCCVKTDNGWEIDLGIPEFNGEGRAYIESRLSPEEE